MNKFLRIFFSPSGKLDPANYTIGIASLLVLTIANIAIAERILLGNNLNVDFFYMSLGEGFRLIVLEHGFPVIFFILYILISYSFYVLQVKRLRFLGRSVWWLLILLNIYWWLGPLLLLIVPGAKAQKKHKPRS